MPGAGCGVPPAYLVVKFSRVAQEAHVDGSASALRRDQRHAMEEAEFNDPFQEFGLVEDLRKSRFVGRAKLDFQFVLTFAAYNLVRMRNLEVAACC